MDGFESRGHCKSIVIPYVTTGLCPPQWSKAVYAFGMAVCTLHLYREEKKAEIVKLFAEIPKLRQRIAGKSIPLEVSFPV